MTKDWTRQTLCLSKTFSRILEMLRRMNVLSTPLRHFLSYLVALFLTEFK